MSRRPERLSPSQTPAEQPQPRHDERQPTAGPHQDARVHQRQKRQSPDCHCAILVLWLGGLVVGWLSPLAFAARRKRHRQSPKRRLCLQARRKPVAQLELKRELTLSADPRQALLLERKSILPAVRKLRQSADLKQVPQQEQRLAPQAVRKQAPQLAAREQALLLARKPERSLPRPLRRQTTSRPCRRQPRSRRSRPADGPWRRETPRRPGPTAQAFRAAAQPPERRPAPKARQTPRQPQLRAHPPLLIQILPFPSLSNVLQTFTRLSPSNRRPHSTRGVSCL